MTTRLSVIEMPCRRENSRRAGFSSGAASKEMTVSLTVAMRGASPNTWYETIPRQKTTSRVPASCRATGERPPGGRPRHEGGGGNQKAEAEVDREEGANSGCHHEGDGTLRYHKDFPSLTPSSGNPIITPKMAVVCTGFVVRSGF